MEHNQVKWAQAPSSQQNNAGAAAQPSGVRIFSNASIVLGVLGGACYWWVPCGMVLSLAGLILGFVDTMIARRRSLTFRLSIVGLLISAVALSLDVVIAVLGLQIVTFGAWR